MWPLEDGMGVEKIEALLVEVQMTFSFIPLKVHFQFDKDLSIFLILEDIASLDPPGYDMVQGPRDI